MHDIRFALPAILFTFMVSSNAFATDLESMPTQETEGGQVASQCLEDLQAFDQTLADVGFGVLPPGGYSASPLSSYPIYGIGSTPPRQKIYSLRDAAYVYVMDGDEKSCQLILSSMRKTYEQHQKLVGIEADDPTLKIAWRRAHIDNAQPVTEMTRLMRANIVIGADIRTADDEKLGEIEDVVLNPVQQNIAYVLASRGGFLGIGEKLVAVRWKDLRVTGDHELYVLDTLQSDFNKAPTVDRNNFENTADSAWRQDLDRFWDQNLE
jgi:sporulation protein YlmC with PRC-barrel domain